MERFSALHARILDRREHFNNDESKDPKLGKWEGNQPVRDNPYADVSKYQSDRPRRVTERLSSRLSENPLVVDTKEPRPGLAREANDLAQILQAWIMDIQERTGIRWQEAAAYGQARDCYAVFHSRLSRDVWQGSPRQVRDALPANETEHGRYEVDTESGQYRETASAYTSRVEQARAREGSPWNVTLIDPLSFVFEEDLSGKRGLRWALVSYEVDTRVYEAQLGGGEMKPADLMEMVQAPGIEQADSGTGGERSHQTPSSTDYQDRVTVYQYWNRDYWCEYVDGAGGAQYKQGGPNPYNCVPFFIAYANRTYHPDPVWNYEPYLEGLYRMKPFWDRMLTLFAAIHELTAEPLMVKRQLDPAKSQLLASGKPASEGGDDGALQPGEDVQQVVMQVSEGLANTLQAINQEFGESEPSTGIVELSSTAQPWTAKIMQTEANVGPRKLMNNLMYALRPMLAMWIDWHARNPKEALVAMGEDKQQGKVVRIDPAEVDLTEFYVTVDVNPVSGAEQVTMMQLMTEMFTHPNGQLITEAEYYEKGHNKKDPDRYAAQVRAERRAMPYVEKAIDAEVSKIMGTRFTLGQNGEIVGADGQPKDPRQVLAANGYRPAVPPQGGGGSEAVPSSMVSMPSQGQLSVPGTIPVAGAV